MVHQHHNKAFRLHLSNSGQSQLHFGTKLILIGACVAKSKKFIYFPLTGVEYTT